MSTEAILSVEQLTGFRHINDMYLNVIDRVVRESQPLFNFTSNFLIFKTRLICYLPRTFMEKLERNNPSEALCTTSRIYKVSMNIIVFISVTKKASTNPWTLPGHTAASPAF